MQRRLFLSILLLLLAACSSAPATPAPAAPTRTPNLPTASPVVSALDTPTPPPAAANVPLPTPPDLPVVSSPALVRMNFQDAENGWGIAAGGGGSILRTVDGGTTWLDATPPGLTGIGYSTVLSVLDVNTAWALVPNVDFFTGVLYHTRDGGLTWTSNTTPFGGAFLQFLDPGTGRALAGRGVSLGSNSVEMYQTSDGGATWLSVFNDDPTRPDASGDLPLSGVKNGMTFLDADTGWVTGTRPVAGEVYLFVTRDGGVSWSRQDIPLPAGYATYQYMPQAPVFFGSDGFLPLMVYLSDTTGFTFYTSHDGGTTWIGDPSKAGSLLASGLYAFADALHGWCWDGGTNLVATTDGAQTWGMIHPGLDLGGRLSQMEFVPAVGSGFTGWALTSVDDTGHSQLYRTTDNGITWMSLIP